MPIISKLFECVLLHITDEFLNTDDRQFGFKKGLGCANAIFVVRSTVDSSVATGVHGGAIAPPTSIWVGHEIRTNSMSFFLGEGGGKLIFFLELYIQERRRGKE